MIPVVFQWIGAWLDDTARFEDGHDRRLLDCVVAQARSAGIVFDVSVYDGGAIYVSPEIATTVRVDRLGVKAAA